MRPDVRIVVFDDAECVRVRVCVWRCLFEKKR